MAFLDSTMLMLLIVIVVVIIVAGVGAYLYSRRSKAARPPAQPASPWGPPSTGTLPSVGPRPEPAAQPQAPPGQPSAQPVFVPPTVERPSQAQMPPAPAVPQPQPAPQTPAQMGQQAPAPLPQPPTYQPASQPVYQPPPAQTIPPSQPFTPAPQPAFETSRTSYFGPTAAPAQPPAQPTPAPAPAQAAASAPQPAIQSQAAMPAPAQYAPPSTVQPPAPSATTFQAPGSAGPEMRHFTKKIILIGDGGVGKTTLIRKFVYDMFDDKYIATIGTKVSKKKVVFPELNLDINLMVWDVQGQRNDPLLTRYFAGAEGAFFVCDVTRFQTFENLPEWIKDFEAVCGKVPMIILGNKSDLVDNAQFGEGELGALAARYNAKAFLTSAKTGANVEMSFNDIGRAITK
jgi:small GTP-binding protein